MNGLKLIETVALDSSSVRTTGAGYLVAEVNCARTGIQEYRASELGLDGNHMIRAWRPEEEVFSEESLKTYAAQPATDDHPPTLVDATNWKQFSIGNIGNEVKRDGEFVRVPLILMDGAVIDKYKRGKCELSMGYLADWDMTPGITPDGEPYDAIQRNLRMNHIALVDKGRAGSEVRIGDSWSSDRKPNVEKPTMTLKTIVVDGLTVETTDAAEKAIVKLQSQLQDANIALTTATVDHEAAIKAASDEKDAAIATKDAEIATKDAKIIDLEKQVVTGAALDAMVANRSAITAKAKLFAKDADFTGKSDAQIKAIAVDAHYGEGFSKDRPDAAIDAVFDTLKEPEPSDKVRDALLSLPEISAPTNDNGYAERCKMLENAHKGAQAK